jgi:hypothetical protein
VKEAAERDRGLLSLVERIMKRPAGAEPVEPSLPVDAEMPDRANPVIVEASLADSLEPQLSIESTHRVSRAEMADIILRALMAVADCPKRGLEVTVYGVRPWNAMLRITPAAQPIKDPEPWRARIREMIPRLRDQYELVD